MEISEIKFICTILIHVLIKIQSNVLDENDIFLIKVIKLEFIS